MNKTTIILIDDHPVVRVGLRTIIGTISEFEVIGEASSFAGARLIAKQQRPDIFISSFTRPDPVGATTLQDILFDFKGSRFVIFSRSTTLDDIMKGLRDGASCYLQQCCEPEELIEAVWVAANGGRYLGDGIAAKALDCHVGNLPQFRSSDA